MPPTHPRELHETHELHIASPCTAAARPTEVPIYTHDLVRQQRLEAKEAEAGGRAGDNDELPLADVLLHLLQSSLVGRVGPRVVLCWLIIRTVPFSRLDLRERAAASPL